MVFVRKSKCSSNSTIWSALYSRSSTPSQEKNTKIEFLLFQETEDIITMWLLRPSSRLHLPMELERFMLGNTVCCLRQPFLLSSEDLTKTKEKDTALEALFFPLVTTQVAQMMTLVSSSTDQTVLHPLKTLPTRSSNRPRKSGSIICLKIMTTSQPISLVLTVCHQSKDLKGTIL